MYAIVQIFKTFVLLSKMAISFSGIFLVDRDFQSTLGGEKRYDEAGRLVYADAAMIQVSTLFRF